jgi:hypothetical protein
MKKLLFVFLAICILTACNLNPIAEVNKFEENNTTKTIIEETQEEEKKPKEIDFVSLRLVNGTQAEAEAEGFIVRKMSKEESYITNKVVIGDMEVDSFNKLYNKVYSEEFYSLIKEYNSVEKTNITEIEIMYDKRKTVLIHPNVLGNEMQRPHKMYESNAVKGDVGEHYDQKGNKHKY